MEEGAWGMVSIFRGISLDVQRILLSSYWLDLEEWRLAVRTRTPGCIKGHT